MIERHACRGGDARWVVALRAVAYAACLVLWSEVSRAQPTLEQVVKETDAKLLDELRARDEEGARWLESALEANRVDDLDRALELYGRLRVRLPDWSPAPRRECGLLGRMNEHGRAVARCREALGLADTAANKSALAMALLAPTLGKRTPEPVAREALALARAALKEAPDDPFAMVASCVSGVAYGDGESVVRCREELPRKLAAEDAADVLALAAMVALGHDAAANAERAQSLAERAVALAPTRPQPQFARYGAALEAESPPLLRVACDGLAAADLRAPAAECAATLAILEKRWGDASAALEQARAAGLEPERQARLTSLLGEREPWTAKYLAPVAWTASAWVAFALFLFVVGLVLSRLTLRAAAELPEAGAGGGGSGLVGWVRGSYRAVLALACVYYYASIPILVGLVLAAMAGVVVAFVALGRLPIRLLVIVGVGGVVTVGALLSSLFRRPIHTEPGERLDLGTQPRLVALLGEVARRIGTRPVDAVYLTTGTEVAVFERGSMLRVLRGKGERCLVLGVAAVGGLTLSDLRSILAHEYGHFSNRDTAGGHVALAVRRSLIAAAVGLARGGAASAVNPAWLFLQGFHRLFLRISHGASRLQEVLADRHAALAYGSGAFARGLRRVVELDVRFDARMTRTLERALDKGVVPRNLYRASSKAKVDEGDVHRTITEALERPPGPYDSHPPPVDRIELVRRLAAADAHCADGDEPAWSLFDQRAEIEIGMSSVIVERINEGPSGARLAIAARRRRRSEPPAAAQAAAPPGPAPSHDTAGDHDDDEQGARPVA